MAVTRSEWARRQVDALVALGDDPREAEDVLRDVQALVPAWGDPASYVPSAADAARTAHLTPTDIFLARVEWYAADWVPARFKRLIDAKVEAGLTEYSPDQPRAPEGTSIGGQWIAVGANSRANGSVNISQFVPGQPVQLKAFASQNFTKADLEEYLTMRPPDDDEYRYFIHATRWPDEVDSIERDGIETGQYAARVWASRNEVRDRGAGHVVFRWPRSADQPEESWDYIEPGLKYRQWEFPNSIPAENIVKIIRAIPIAHTQGQTIDEQQFVRWAMQPQHSDQDRADLMRLPELYQKLFTVIGKAARLSEYSPDQPRAPEGTDIGGQWIAADAVPQPTRTFGAKATTYEDAWAASSQDVKDLAAETGWLALDQETYDDLETMKADYAKAHAAEDRYMAAANFDQYRSYVKKGMTVSQEYMASKHGVELSAASVHILMEEQAEWENVSKVFSALQDVSTVTVNDPTGIETRKLETDLKYFATDHMRSRYYSSMSIGIAGGRLSQLYQRGDGSNRASWWLTDRYGQVINSDDVERAHDTVQRLFTDDRMSRWSSKSEKGLGALDVKELGNAIKAAKQEDADCFAATGKHLTELAAPREVIRYWNSARATRALESWARTQGGPNTLDGIYKAFASDNSDAGRALMGAIKIKADETPTQAMIRFGAASGKAADAHNDYFTVVSRARIPLGQSLFGNGSPSTPVAIGRASATDRLDAINGINISWDKVEHGEFRASVSQVYRTLPRVPNLSAYNALVGSYDNERRGFYHGTDFAAAAGIARTGFMVPKTAKTGRMLGDGVYLTPVASKSAQYIGESFGRSSGATGILLQVRAALGRVEKRSRYAPSVVAETVAALKADGWVRNDEYCVKDPAGVMVEYIIEMARERV